MSFTRLDPETVEQIVAICNSMLRDLEKSAVLAQHLGEPRDFGELESARQLSAGFARKGAGTPESARERMDQFIAALTELRDAFATGGEAFLGAQFEWARRLAATDQEQ